MQKKDRFTQNQEPSAWEESLKKAQRTQNLKKYGIWIGVVAVFVVGLLALVKVAGTSPTTQPVATPNLPPVKSTDIIVGDKNAKVALIEYADLQCPACASYNPLINSLMKKNVGKVKYVFRFFPLTGVHKNAVISAQATYASYKQGKFDEMKDLLFSNQKDWELTGDPRPIFIGYAKEIGLNEEKFNTDMNSEEANRVVLAGEKEAVGLGLNSTPTFFVGNRFVVPKSEAEFQVFIDEELKKTQ